MSAFSTISTSLAVTLDNNAGGASAADLGLAGAVGGFALIFMLMGGLGHRGDLIPTLGWFERFSEKVSGQPAWASLPCGLAIISLITALFGLYWDVSLHIDRGRDPGVFSNPSHWFILGGLYGIFAAGFFAICLGREERADRPGPTAVRIGKDWYAPLGGIMMMVCGFFSLIAFPLDDFWHRLFGQDVTLWGPTHLMLIGGAVMTLIAIAIIQAEVVRAMKTAGVMHLELAWVRHLRVVWLPGGLLVGMSTFQGEFDWGVPQFQMIFHPMLIMLAAGLTLVMTRIWIGRGGMFGAIGFFLIARFLLDVVIVHKALGESLAHFPLYIAEALCVELAAIIVSTRRPLAFGLTAGALIGTVGLAAEWGWSHVWMPLPWSVEILPETIVFGLGMALAASVLGAWIGARLSADDLPYAETKHLRWPAVGAAVAIFVMLALPLNTQADSDVSAEVALTTVKAGPERTVNATVTLTPRDAADKANWLTITSWQGDGQLITDRLERVAQGVYRSTQPVPVYGQWKTMVRLHTGNSISGLPIYAPEDPAIPAPRVAAPASFERDFYSDRQLLQRELKPQSDPITNAAYGTVLVLALGLLAMLAWGLHRVGTTAGRKRDGSVPEWQQVEFALDPHASDRNRTQQPAGATSANGSNGSNGHEELPDWARPQPERETADSGSGESSVIEEVPAGPPAAGDADGAGVPHVRLAIVGTGFAGLGLAIHLKEQGIEDFVLIERADDVGGTWQANTYPGCQCDVPSHLYSFSFAPNPDWTRTYSRQPEIWQYLRDVAANRGLYPHIHFGHDLTAAAWDSERGRWNVETSRGAWTAQLLIDATGPLSYPAVPRIRGMGSFKGTVFHSAEWNHDHDLTGERVAVIGTGASAIQFVPRIADQVGQMHVFQRTAPWILPHGDRPTTRFERRLYKTFPFLQKAVRSGVYWSRESFLLGFIKNPKIMGGAEKIAAAHMRHQVKDPELRRKLTPKFRLGCKRVLISNDWYPALTRDNVELVTDGIEAIRGNTIICADGSTREVDTIIFGTGFHVTDPPSARLVRGRDGGTLADRMQAGIQAYLGATVEGLPNYFKLIGPNTGLGHNSMVYMIESQLNYVMDALRVMDQAGYAEFEIRPDAMAAYNAQIQSKLPGTVWMSGCASWYLDADGKNTTIWPDFTWRFRHRTRRFDTRAYVMRRPAEVSAPAQQVVA